jgi:hypothetical protein
MDEKTKVFQFSIQPSLVDRVKGMGNGKFPAGLYFLLREYDRLQGTVEKHDDQIANKGVRKSEFKEDPRLPRLPGEHQAKYNARLTVFIANLPETRAAAVRNNIRQHFSTPDYHVRSNWELRDNGEPEGLPEWIKYEAYPTGLGMESDTSIFDYITEDERDQWLAEGKAKHIEAFEANKKRVAELVAAPTKPRVQTKQLTPEALLGYGFKRTPLDMSDEAIEAINAEWAPGGEHYGDDPIREMEK